MHMFCSLHNYYYHLQSAMRSFEKLNLFQKLRIKSTWQEFAHLDGFGFAV